ncbi:Succinate dehydrogenase assembly factor 1, mitochondrial [Lachancea thermotolerans]|uniref:KLTH0F15576p n=1 Tax=Lachancea thermotolerans (strain ATCC 56472 / CBS 6340 / NRRL Y-8284) TaxID=559295 RepID=C5DJD6_LACTC|nr:KLTH0F15576p [Lachancea thermotolerans CBS 6340]CAR24425.1 KLTH0F15576p [Lachancea thermotolerans CBS 6340]
MAKRLSGLQREVLQMYRQCIRAAHDKPKANQPNFVTHIRKEFRQYQDLPRKDFSTIEHLLRVGHRRLEMYSQPEVKDIH